ncbi:MAG: hypothetical protein LBV69_10735 [Bacteroidales bacterium]|jgi:hypothetical protein|nr:hypothetical protein [Bacteroidales bacterium]
MKKLFILLIVALAMFFATNDVFCATPPVKYEVLKEGGKRLWYAPWIIEYNRVEWTLCPTCENASGRLECTGEGPNRCKLPTSVSSPISINDNMFDGEIIHEICNEINEFVDKSISEKKSDGTVSKKYLLKTTEDKEKLIVFYTSWKNANCKTGDVKYTISIEEIYSK